ncbi:hypothetical protein DL98DRAFT_439400 [Cadophora sp. DSE1049]|nr:hypothetical protein DL98DRAFT_439400 [Cadophora sp. DSE1049]
MYNALESKLSIQVLIFETGSYRDPICCRLSHVNFADNLEYEALSYVWGDASQTKALFCQGSPMQATISLHGALRHLRQEYTERVIWADDICINQQDIDEKSHQVVLMGKIYPTAIKCLSGLAKTSRG